MFVQGVKAMKYARLSNMCQKMIDKKYCRGEENSDFSKRPLRFSQEHFAVLEVWMLPLMAHKLMMKAEDEDFSKEEINLHVK
jgi:ribonuclease D